MRVHDWDWDGFPDADESVEDNARHMAKARENAPPIVLGEMANVLFVALGVAFAINIALAALHIG
jgi:hypothetical protein